MSEQSIWVGMPYARRFGRLGLGVSGYVVIGTAAPSGDITWKWSDTEFSILSRRIDQTIVGLVGAFGARYDVSDHLKLGLSVFTQEAGIYQDRRYYGRLAGSARHYRHCQPRRPARIPHAAMAYPARRRVGRWTLGIRGRRDVFASARCARRRRPGE